MGKPTGFLEYNREEAPAYEISEREMSGSKVHGMRRAFLPVRIDAWRNDIRLSAEQSDTRVE